MSFSIDTALVNAYRNAIEIQFQQKGSRLRPAVRVESQNAEYEYYDRIAPTASVKLTTRHSDTPLISTEHGRRRNGMDDYVHAELVDKPDKIRMLADPTNPYAMNAVYAHGRAIDDAIISAAFGTAYTGKTGATSVTFPAASEIAVDYVETGSATNSNLTIGKLRRARKLLDDEEAGEMPLFIAGGPSQKQSLLRSTEVTSSDYNVVKALVNGEINTFMGFNFIWLNRLPVASNIREAIAWSMDGLLLGVGDEINVDIRPRPDKNNSIQVFSRCTFGATRMWEEKVLRIKCDETK